MKSEFQTLNTEKVKGRIPAIQETGVSLRLCKGLGGCLASSTVLAHLELKKIIIAPNNIKFISKGLSQNNCLRELLFVDCKIGDDGFAVLYNGLCKNSTITDVEFSGCNLTDKSAIKMGKLIQHHAMRRHTVNWMVSLRGGSAGDLEPVHQEFEADSLQSEKQESRGLTRVGLMRNQISNVGAFAIAEALKFDVWITEVNLSSNFIGLEGAKALKDTLIENTTLIALILRDNKITDPRVISEIASGVEINADEKHHPKAKLIVERKKPQPTHTKQSHILSKSPKKSPSRDNYSTFPRSVNRDEKIIDELRNELIKERMLRSHLENKLHTLADENQSLSSLLSSQHSSQFRHSGVGRYDNPLDYNPPTPASGKGIGHGRSVYPEHYQEPVLGWASKVSQPPPNNNDGMMTMNDLEYKTGNNIMDVHSSLNQFSEHVRALESIAGEGHNNGAGDEEDGLLEMLENSFKRFSTIIDNLEKDTRARRN